MSFSLRNWPRQSRTMILVIVNCWPLKLAILLHNFCKQRACSRVCQIRTGSMYYIMIIILYNNITITFQSVFDRKIGINSEEWSAQLVWIIFWSLSSYIRPTSHWWNIEATAGVSKLHDFLFAWTILYMLLLQSTTFYFFNYFVILQEPFL